MTPISPDLSSPVYSHFPAIPPPMSVSLTVLPPQRCPYYEDRPSTVRAVLAHEIDSAIYHQFMDAGFRRSGRMLYQPVCSGCRACVQIRVPTAAFSMSRSQKRCWKRNADLSVTVSAPPRPTVEKYQLYRRYLRARHDGQQEESRHAMEEFLYTTPTQTLEFEYRLPTGRLVAVGICDVASNALSSVYFYFDPDESRKRGLGIYGALREIMFAREHAIAYYYLGYWIEGSPTMNYKADFRPNQVLGGDGVFRENCPPRGQE
jgi:leucyl-tRNA---protein transferase